MTEYISNNELSPIEIALNQDMYTGEGSEGLDALDTHLVAKRALYDMVDDTMQGKGESAEAVEEYINLILIEAAQGYARAVQVAEDTQDTYQLAAELIYLSLAEMKELADNYQCNVSINADATVSDLIEAFKIQAEDIDSAEEEFTMLEETYGELHRWLLSMMLQYAQDNENDMRREKRDALKVAILDMTKDTAKIALGAIAAVALVRLLSKK